MKYGIGVMLGMLGGNEETVTAIKSSLNKGIKSVSLENDELKIVLSDGVLKLYDDGQSCCESRYMRTDDDLSDFEGATLMNFELKQAPDIEDGGEVHEVQFLEVTTSKGSFVMSSHNEHNGYYGGFHIVARLESL